MDSDVSLDVPLFYKIVHPQIIMGDRLRIPKPFVTNYGKDLSNYNKVSLHVPNGDVWLVNLGKANGDVWLENGWKEFSDHYSVCLYHFLVFRYRGNLSFEVVIFDKSASEIEYPSPKPVLHQHKRKCEFDVKLKNPSSLDFIRKVQDEPNEAGKQRAMELAKSFKSKSPFFMIQLTQYFMKCNSSIPVNFRKEHLKNMKDSVEFTLEVSGKTWVVVYNAYFYKMGKGWGKFAVDNHLVAGDVCIFELTKEIKTFFYVTIFRATKNL